MSECGWRGSTITTYGEHACPCFVERPGYGAMPPFKGTNRKCCMKVAVKLFNECLHDLRIDDGNSGWVWQKYNLVLIVQGSR